MCRRLAKAGCSAPQIAAISGHLTLAEVQRYIEGANKKHMAHQAMQAITEQKSANLPGRLANLSLRVLFLQENKKQMFVRWGPKTLQGTRQRLAIVHGKTGQNFVQLEITRRRLLFGSGGFGKTSPA